MKRPPPRSFPNTRTPKKQIKTAAPADWQTVPQPGNKMGVSKLAANETLPFGRLFANLPERCFS